MQVVVGGLLKLTQHQFCEISSTLQDHTTHVTGSRDARYRVLQGHVTCYRVTRHVVNLTRDSGTVPHTCRPTIWSNHCNAVYVVSQKGHFMIKPVYGAGAASVRDSGLGSTVPQAAARGGSGTARGGIRE